MVGPMVRPFIDGSFHMRVSNTLKGLTLVALPLAVSVPAVSQESSEEGALVLEEVLV